MVKADPVGVYSISVRGFEVEDLLVWANENAIPFLHLRGGPRGVDLVNRSPGQLEHWRRVARHSVPVTGVTADVDLADLVTGDEPTRRAAWEQVRQLCAAAHRLGARWVRLLARAPLTRAHALPSDPVLPTASLPLLVELHHPRWLDPDAFTALVALMRRHRGVRLLADTAQLGAALAGGGDRGIAAAVLDWSRVVHLSDDGTGLTHPEREEIATLAARRVAQGRAMEVALEWTGTDRSPRVCLDRYRSALAWWARVRARTGATR
ncbi:hypothetical protein FHX37_3771 [Haloactinospora alba]|uniref:Xylose isomerase-like TIM barrel protein n=1 Tax=Haloactinospora alba TaxID=405555 RepID=A0A543N9B3_9ACTN|nr:AP endonuclease [Haloactinospora alba]TQN28426.1 hypothetical protein FHX37_3771 [Haloactinospora alba]